MTSIRRGEDWWHRREDGDWLRWSAAAQAWEPRSSGPPPPPPPPPGPSSPLPEPAAAAVASPVEQPAAARAEPAPEIAETAPMPAVAAAETPDVATAPLPVVPAAPRPANGEVYSASSPRLLARVDSRTLTLVGGSIGIILVFVLTYLGASFVFRPTPGEAATRGAGSGSPRQAFVLDMNELCSQATQSAMGLPPPGNFSAMARFTKRAMRTQRRLVSEMRSKVPPAKDRALFRRIVKQSRVQLGQMHTLLAEAQAGDEAGVDAAMGRLAASERRIDRMSVNLGLKECN